MAEKTLLVITDGIGHNNSSSFNAFSNAKTPTYDYLFENVPYSLVHTYGKYVGLPHGQMGNSEVGHMTIGSGRVLYQDLVKINMAIKEDTLKENKVFNSCIQVSNTIHLVGLISDGGVHSHINHIIAMAKIIKASSKKVFIHIITDGRDVAPDCANKYIKEIIDICDDDIKIATIAGRYYSMDRDNRWERVKKAYDTMAFAQPSTNTNIIDYVNNSYKENIFDEFIEPTAFDVFKGIEDNDGIIFCNFRSDRMRELSSIFAKSDFNEFKTKKINLNLATMTQYDKNTPLPILFPKDSPKNTLAEVISNAQLNQLHTAETEKYAHVTFFFNGGIEEPFENESRVLIPSPSVATYDLQPEMSALEVKSKAVENIKSGKYDTMVLNFANPDMVGHTGIMDAAVSAIETIDKYAKDVIEAVLSIGGKIIITADHGNLEQMLDFKTGNPMTAHTTNPVNCIVVGEGNVKLRKNSNLADVAPTMLDMMNLEKPKEMSGTSIIIR